MSLFQSIYDRTTLFNDSTYRETNRAYQIEIWPMAKRANGGDEEDAHIVGMLTSPINISLNANYDTMNIGSVVSNIPMVGELVNAVGNVLEYAAAAGYANMSKSGIFTKKFYTSTGYLFLNPQFRVVDWEGKGSPLITSCALLNYCLPKRVKNISDVMNKLKSWYKVLDDMVPNNSTVDGWIAKAQAKVDMAINAVTTAIGDKDILSRAAKETIGDPDALILSSSPTPVLVKIGDYFENWDMVIEHVGVQFSKQLTASGPLFVDFDVQLSSRNAVFVDGLGFQQAKKRVVRENAQNAFDKNFKGL